MTRSYSVRGGRSVTGGVVVLVLVFLLCPVPSGAQTDGSLAEARTLEEEGRLAEARKSYRAAARANPTSPEAHQGWLRLAIETSSWEEGERALRRYENLESGLESPARLGSRLYFRQEAYDTALTWAERYRNRASTDWEPYHFLARINVALGDYLTAEKMVESAELRTDDNQWVRLDDFLVNHGTGRLDRARSIAFDLSEEATNPTVHWALARRLGGELSRGEVVDLLEPGGSLLPAGEPPLAGAVDEKRYRYWWARMNAVRGSESTARDVQSGDPADFRSRWLAAHLTEGDSDRLRAQADVLDRWTDKLIAQWQQSVLARRLEALRGEYRRRSSDFFFDEYEDNRYLDIDEAALSAMIRSLEMDPLREENQFELASYFGSRGWGERRRSAAERAQTLGYDPPTKVADYLEGLGEPDTSPQPSPPSARVGVRVDVESPWEGPLDGENTIERMIRHNFYHQPAFEVLDEDPDGVPLSRMVQGDTLEGGVRLTVGEWDDELSVELEYFLPEGRLVERSFYDGGQMKVWRLVDRVVSETKNLWLWTGTTFRVTRDGAWVNLGRIHGFETGDTLPFKTGSPPFDGPPEVDEIEEDRLRIGFPSPYYKTEVQRGVEVGPDRGDTEP